MKFAACLGVKDEVELIGPCIAHLRAIGAELIIVSDAGSTDGTMQVVQRMMGPDLRLIPFDDRSTDPQNETRLTRRIVQAARAEAADWLLFLDADEFPLPAGGSLHRLQALDGLDVLELPRHNVPLRRDGAAMALPPALHQLNQVLLYAPDAPRQATMARVRQDPDLPWISGVPVPKTMINLATVDDTGEGHHTAERSQGPTRSALARDMVVAHVPFTTEARFARKVANMTALVRDLGHLWGPDSAWHWRRWLDNVAARGGVAAEVARNTVTEAELSDLRRVGVVKTAAELLAAAQAQPGPAAR